MLNSFGQGSVQSLSEELLLSMTVSSESVCVDKELESRSMKSVGTLSMNSRMISVSGTDSMTLMMARALIAEVELKLTNIPPIEYLGEQGGHLIKEFNVGELNLH